MKITIQSLIIISLLLSLTTRASSDILIESFQIMPTICVVARDNSCQQNIRFQWKLSNESKSCLYQVGNKTPLYCSDMEQQASVVLMLDVEKENEFILRLSGTSVHEVRRQLKVRELGKDVRQSRRHLWSVF
jgi:hypothetical protein